MSYVRRRIDLTFGLGQGQFGDTGSTTLKLSDMRVECQIGLAQLPTPGGQCYLRVYGMTLDHINQLSVAGLNWRYKNNTVKVEAGDEGSTLTTIYTGKIVEAYPDFNTQPQVSFVVSAVPAVGLQMTPVAPVSVKGTGDVTTLLSAIVKPFGFTVENNGVSVKLSNPYLQGSAWTQVMRVVKAANVFATLDSVLGVLAIYPKTGTRATPSPTLIAPETGMIGYPAFQQPRIVVRTLFNPSIKGTGYKIRVKSQLTAANGDWKIDTIDYKLASRLPGGDWMMVMVCSNPNLSQGGG